MRASKSDPAASTTRFEYVVTWRRKDGRKRRAITQGDTASNDRFDRLDGESDECTCYNRSTDPATPGYSCIDYLEPEERCSPCAGDYATDVSLLRREVGEWEEPRPGEAQEPSRRKNDASGSCVGLVAGDRLTTSVGALMRKIAASLRREQEKPLPWKRTSARTTGSTWRRSRKSAGFIAR